MQPENDLRFTLKTPEREQLLSLPPEGWKNYSAGWRFDEGMFGYNRSYAMSLKYVKEGAQFLRDEVSKYGTNAMVWLIVERYDRQAFVWKPDFSGQFKFDAYKNERDFFEADIMQSGIKQIINQHGKASFEIPFSSGSPVINVPEGMLFLEQAEYYMPKFAYNNLRDLDFFPKMNIQSEESKILSYYMIFKNQEQGTPFLDISSYGQERQIKMKVIVELAARVAQVSPLIYDVDNNHIGIFLKRVYKNSSVEYIEIYRSPKIYRKPETNLDIRIEYTEDIPQDVNIKEYSLVTKTIYNNTVNTLIMEGSVSFSYFGSASTGPFKFPAFHYRTLGRLLLDRMQDAANLPPETPIYRCNIPFLDAMEAQGYGLFATSADAIRGLSIMGNAGKTAVLKTNYNDFRKALNFLYCVGERNTEDGVTFVPRQEIWDMKNELVDVGTVKNLNIQPLDEEKYLKNIIAIGYEKQEYDYSLGRQEFAPALEFTNKLITVGEKIELISPYRADYTGVHLLHYDYATSPTKDTKNDNDVFLIIAYRVGDEWQAVEGIGLTPDTQIFGLEGGGYFNGLISPHQNLRRWDAWFCSILDKIDKTLYYQSSEETYSDVTIQVYGEQTKEKSNENTARALPLFRPIMFEFDCIVKKSLPQMMGEDPCGYIGFNYNGHTLKGFPLEIEGSYTDSSQKVICVAHPETPSNIESIIFKRNWRQ